MTLSLKKFQVTWSTTFPAIVDNEYILIDLAAKLRPGNIILLKDQKNQLIPAIIVNSFLGKYIIKTDNNPLNYLTTEKKIIGVVVGKTATIPRNRLSSFLLNMFILLSSISHFLRFKVSTNSRYLELITLYFSYPELIQYNHHHDNTEIIKLLFNQNSPINADQYNLRKIALNRIILITKTLKKTEIYKKENNLRNALLHELANLKIILDKHKIKFSVLKGGSYSFTRDMSDIDILTNEFNKVKQILKSIGFKETVTMKNESHFEKSINKLNLCFDIHKKLPSISFSFDFPVKTKLNLTKEDQLLISCTHSFKQRQLFLRDIYDVLQLTNKLNLENIKIKNKGVFDILGGPLIIGHILDKEFNNTKNKNLASFVTKNYSKETKIAYKYLKARNFEFPISLYQMYKKHHIFGLYKFLRRPAEFTPHPSDNIFIRLLKSCLVKIRTISINHYSNKKSQ